MWVHGDFHRVADALKIIKRLAHAHQNDVGQQAGFVSLCACAGFGPFAEIVTSDHDLADNLSSSQVADEFLRTGVTERTS